MWCGAVRCCAVRCGAVRCGAGETEGVEEGKEKERGWRREGGREIMRALGAIYAAAVTHARTPAHIFTHIMRRRR